MHRVEHTAMDGLEPVAHIWQGTTDDHAHRVIEEACPDFLVELPRLYPTGAEWFVRQIRHLDVQVSYFQCVLLDEEPARLDLVAHQP